MPKYASLTTDYRLHFKNLIENKPDLEVGGKKVSWEVLERNVKILSEPVDAVNIEKLPMRRGLASYRIAEDNGKQLVALHIRESNVVAFFKKFPNLDPPAWFDQGFKVDPAVDQLFGLRIFNFATATAVYEPFKKKRKLKVVDNPFSEPNVSVTSEF